MTFVVNALEVEGTITINGVDVTSDIQSVGEKIANAGGVVSFAANVTSLKPTAGTIDRVFISTDDGIISYDNGTSWENVLPAYTGDVTSTVGGTVLTLATVNSAVGTFGDSANVPVITVNGKGLITNITSVVITKSSVGLNNVQNVDTTNASNITSGTLSNARLTTNLSQIGGLVQSNGDIIAVVGGVYAARTIAQYKTDLSLNNVANVDTTNASNISSGTLANARLTANLSQLGGITFNANDFIQYNGSAIVNVTPSAVKTSLSLVKGDIGLGNVANIDTTNASNISSGTLANARLTTNLSQIGGLVQSNGDIIAVVGGVYAARSIAQYKTDLSLNNVANVDTTDASNISSGTLANARLTTNLSQLGSITFNANDVMQFNGTTLTNISMASLKTSLSLTKTDVGLGNVVNVDTTNASNISSGTLANARLTANLSQIGSITFNANDYLQFNGLAIVNVTPSAVKTSLSLVKGDVGLGNVANVDTTNASNISSGTLANARLTANLSQIGGLTLSTNDFIQYNGTTLTNVTPSAVKTSLSLVKGDVGLGNVANSLQVINAGGAVSYAIGLNSAKPAAGTSGRQYLSSDQGITYYDNGSTWTANLPAYAGDVTSSLGGTALTLATVNSNVGTFNNLTVNGKGLVTSASNVSYLTGNQTITLSGDITGSGTTGITGTLATVNSNTGSFGSTSVVPIITVNGKGLITAVSTGTITPTSIGLGNVTNSLQVINAGTAVSLASGTNASKPAAGTAGRFYDSTDQGLIYFDNGTTWTAQVPAYTGDVTSTLGGSTLTLATVNSNIGTFNNVTVNAKGLVTAASNVSYLTGNQTITVTGDATGSGTTGIALTLASVNSNVGTFNNVTVNAKGLVTAASNVSYVADSGTNGIMVRTALNTTTSRSITGTTNQITVTNGNGVAGDPTVLIADNPVLPGTGSVTLPTGTSAQRDSAAVNGKLRWNTDLLQVEVSDTNVYRILGKVTQFITGNIAQTTGTTILPYDATLPQSTEGFQIWTANITPLYNNSTIVVIFNIFTEVSTANNTMSVALFNGTTAIATNSGYTGVSNTATSLSIIKTFTSGTTSTITLSARSGPSVASTMYVNRGNTETLSGAPNTSYIIMEIV